MLRVRDDRERVLLFAGPPKRVVSLVPSDTYSLAAIGCEGALVGRTDYCVEPRLEKVPTVGGTKNPRIEDVLDLAPDLVLANQEENTRSDLEALAQKGARVYVSFPRRVADGLAHVAKLSRVFGAPSAARELCKRGYEAVREAEKARSPEMRAFCPIWLDPLMTINQETFISDMLELAGFTNVFSDRERRYPLAADLGRAPPKPAPSRDTRYPRVTMEEVRARDPEIVLLPDEPYAFEEKHKALFEARAELVSGKDLCWYGAWSVGGLGRLRALRASLSARGASS